MAERIAFARFVRARFEWHPATPLTASETNERAAKYSLTFVSLSEASVGATCEASEATQAKPVGARASLKSRSSTRNINREPKLFHIHLEDLQMTFSSAGRIAEKLPAGLVLAMLFPGKLAAQGQPVETASHLPVALWFVGAGVLGLVLAYGIIRNRRRTPAEKRITEQATKDLYKRENRDS